MFIYLVNLLVWSTRYWNDREIRNYGVPIRWASARTNSIWKHFEQLSQENRSVVCVHWHDAEARRPGTCQVLVLVSWLREDKWIDICSERRRERQTDERTGRETTDTQTGRQAGRQAGMQADRQTDRLAGRLDRKATYIHTHRQTERRTNRQTGEQTTFAVQTRIQPTRQRRKNSFFQN